MTYLIIRETEYINIENSFHVIDQTTDIDIADDKLRGYILINTNPKESYTILKHENPLVLTEEMRVA
tara:strand:+ start:433 stop:633 length:201 start_codon:yes stop_codon:yes gene_type:complete